MLAYILCFISSITLSYVAEVRLKKYPKRVLLPILIILFSALILSLLAGFRDYSIGIDVSWYVTPYYTDPNKDFVSLWQSNGNIEPLFYFLVWSIKMLGGNASIALFFIQFISISAFNLFFYLNRNRISIGFSTFIYCFVFFNYSLSLMRQFLAIPFLLIGYHFIREKRIFPFLIAVSIATLFHYPSIFYASLIFVFALKTKSNFLRIIKIVAFFLFVFAFVNLKVVASFLNSVGILNDTYFNRFLIRESEGGINIYRLSLIVLSSVLPFLFLNKECTNLKSNQDLLFLSLAAVIVDFSAIYSSYISRLSYSTMSFIIVSLGLMSIKSNYKNQIFYYLVKYSICIFLIAYWLLIFCYFNSFETYPYMHI